MTNGTGWRSRLLGEYWFANLPADLQDALLAAARQRRVTPGKLLFAKGDAPCGLYALVEGAVRMGTAEEQRRAAPTEVVRPPYWFGEVSLFDGLPRLLDVYSMQQSIFLHISQPVIDALLAQHPEYKSAFAALLSHKIGLSLPNRQTLQSLPDRARVAWRILVLGEGYGVLSNARRVLTLDDIQAGVSVGLSRQALVEVLQDLQRRKIIRLDPDLIEVLDVDKLRKVAQVAQARSSA